MLKILFVDDEQRLLDALSRLLRPNRERWCMSFALGGQAAIEALESGDYDIAISDMRMPDVDGLAVLRYARERSPGTVRIALSGQTDLDVMTHSLSVVHQFISKPCGPSALQTIIERVSSLQALLRHPVLQAVVGQMGELPTLPRTYQQLVEAIDNPEASTRDVVRIVEQDVAIAARCLQITNSAYFGLRRRIETLEQAVSYLGLSTLRAIVLSSSVFSSSPTTGRLTHAELERLQRHAFQVGNLARLLLVDEDERQQAFMAGMLHDIGKLVLATLDADPPDMLATSTPGGAVLPSIEVTHAEVGAYLLGLWGLPHTIVEAVAFHLHPERVPRNRLDVLGAVYLANGLLAERERTDARPANDPSEQITSFLATIESGERLEEFRSFAALVGDANGGHRD